MYNSPWLRASSMKDARLVVNPGLIPGLLKEVRDASLKGLLSAPPIKPGPPKP
jgi:hypothetical protein